ncbi:MAG: elongation factor G [Clostridiales bacterium]|nr:elongation factor G [Clostridiales bacterium]
MKQYPMDKVRNVVLLGQGRSGKTSFVEAALYLNKGTDRFGKVNDGTTVSDYDPEEIRRQISISLTVAPVEYQGCKLNLIDTPGYLDFVGEVMQGVRVAETALIVVSGKDGPGVGTEKGFAYATAGGLSKLFFVGRMDEEHVDYFKVVEQLRETFGISVCPINCPIMEGDRMVGLVDFVERNVKTFKNGVAEVRELPEDIGPQASHLWDMLSESVAETSEELMEKYFGGEYFTRDETVQALKAGIAEGTIAPVMCGSAISLEGVNLVVDMLAKATPSPADRGETQATVDGKEAALKADPAGDLAAIVFKTVADPFVGKMSFFKVVSGTMKADSQVTNSTNGQNEKIGKLFFIRGNKQQETAAVGAGDIGFVSKLGATVTGDTLCAAGKKIVLPGITFPRPAYAMSISPLAKGDEEKISTGLQRLAEEDRTFTYALNPETKQQVVSGLGDVHLDVLVSKLKNKFGTGVELGPIKVPYRETIRKKVKVQGRHKKQSGGHGQFGDVWVEFEPGDTEDLIFEEHVFGGSVPKNFFPAVEKGLRESIQKGVLAGYPVVNLKATLVDGSYHPVDSSEMAFKVAANLAYKAGMTQASPVLLEPIGSLKVRIPDSMMGDIIGDINKRRGRILGMNPVAGGLQEVDAEVPMAEMNGYAVDLRSMTQGRGDFELELARYEEAPANVAQKVIQEAAAGEE